MPTCNIVLHDRMAVKKKDWTAEDNERLRAFVAKGTSIIQAAAALKRTTVSIRRQARKLGTPFPPMKDYRKQFQDSPTDPRRQT